MKALGGSRSRFISGVAVSLGLALVGLQPLAAQAATPTISATVLGRTTIQVSGYGFGSGDRVMVVDSVGGKVFTWATRTILPPPPPIKCTSSNPCQYFPIVIGGRISTTLPKHVVQCLFESVSVRAYDLTTHTHSNVARVILGFGLCK
ncbi:MAG TPA: hypothetical protein VNL35_01440 [Chloroflexota bacterium]|nr:hypothetical protein [Chloroflexota bacterium]